VADDVKAKLDKYLKNAEGLFEGVFVCSGVGVDAEAAGKVMLDSALNYYHDARHFYERGEFINALAALEYAEGWLDAGKAIGVIGAGVKESKS